MNPMQKISIYYAGLTKAEKSTCDLILDHPEIVIENPIAEAARLYNVSPSSIPVSYTHLVQLSEDDIKYLEEAYVPHNIVGHQ